MKNCYKMLYALLYDGKSIRKRFAAVLSSKIRKDRHAGLINKHVENHRYASAVEYIEKNRIQRDDRYKRLYAYCLQAEGREEASGIMLECLESEYNVDAGEMTAFLADRINVGKSLIEYRYLGGLGNLGNFLVKNEAGSFAYIVKILDRTKKNNEVFFYREIAARHAEIAEHIPFCRGIYEYGDKLRFLCMEYIDPRPVDSACDSSAVKFVEKLGSISRSECLGLFSESRVRLYAGNAEVSRLHRCIPIKMIVEKELLILENTPDSALLSAQIRETGNRIADGKLYRKVVPSIHYTFCHNDFHRKNLFKAGSDGIKAFDWNNFRTGIYGWDLIYYWGNFESPFSEIKRLFIDPQRAKYSSRSSMSVWNLFFDFCLIYVWICRLHGKSCAEYMDDFFMPAVEDIRELISALDKA